MISHARAFASLPRCVTVVVLLVVSHVARADIGPPRLLVAGGKGCNSPTWSPDGTHIAYRQYGGPRFHPALYVANADGSKPRELVPPSPLGGPLAWSPDSSRIAYTSH